MDTTGHLIFLPLALIMFIIPIALVTLIVLIIARIYKHENIGENLFYLIPFWGLLTVFYFTLAFTWDLFVEGTGKLFTYWDQLPWSGFYIFGHDHPIAVTLKTGGLAPGINLQTLDVIWLILLIIMYLASLGVFWRLRKYNAKSFRLALIISIILFIAGCVLGLNRGASSI